MKSDSYYKIKNTFKIFDDARPKPYKAFLSNFIICMKKKKNRNKPPLKPNVSCKPRESIVIDYFSLAPDKLNFTYGL